MSAVVSVKRNGVYAALGAAIPVKVKKNGVYVDAQSLSVKGNGAYVAQGALPSNTVAPSIAGTAAVGSTLTCTPGTWVGSPAPTLTRKWQAGGVDIPGATGLTYVVAAGDAGKSIRVVETGTNVLGSASANSNAIAIP